MNPRRRTQCDPALAAALHSLRIQRGMSQERLAVEAGLTTSAFARIERGLADPHWTTIRRIATTHDLSLTELATTIEDAREKRSPLPHCYRRFPSA